MRIGLSFVRSVDIAYVGEPSVDNVNRRKRIYETQLSINSWDTGTQSLQLNDVSLLVVGGKLVLYAKSLGKRLIPRLSTAYNYRRSDLSLFRVLCDVQVQGIAASLMPDWQGIFKGFSHILRIQYKNIVLSPQSWKVEYDSTFEADTSFVAYVQSRKVTRFIKVGQADQTLKLDMESTADRKLLVSILKMRKTLWLYESFKEEHALVTDSAGRKYSSELVLSFYHDKEVYKGMKPPADSLSIQRSFAPGSEWLYYKLYGHTSVMDAVLAQEIAELVNMVDAHIDGWFFIRYDEGGDHIRLRFRLKQRDMIGSVMYFVHARLHPLLEAGILSKMLLDTYVREIERYGAADIAAVEQLFGMDSANCLIRLQRDLSIEDTYRTIIALVNTVGTKVFGAERLPALIKQQRDYFNAEHRMDSALFKKLNADFNTWMQFNAGDDPQLDETELLNSYVQVLIDVDPSRQSQLFFDLFHMHINRQFASEQRIHEMVIYNYLFKLLMMTLKKNGALDATEGARIY